MNRTLAAYSGFQEEPGEGPRPAGGWRAALFDVNTSLIGFGAGLLNELIGIGGGILIVPGLILRRKVEVRVAVSTSLAAIVILSLQPVLKIETAPIVVPSPSAGSGQAP